MAAVTTHSDFGAQVEEICHCFHLFPSICHGGSDGKASACNAGDLGLIPGLGRSPGQENSYPLQYSGLENSMDCIVREVEKSQTQLSDFHLLTHSLHSLTQYYN